MKYKGNKRASKIFGLVLALSLVGPWNPLAKPLYQDISSSVNNLFSRLKGRATEWLFTNDLVSENKSHYNNNPNSSYYRSMHFRFRPQMGKLAATWSYLNGIIGEIKSGKEYNRDLSILVDKSDGEMILRDGEDLLKKYNVATGEHPGQRQKDGDGRTPEGSFFIAKKIKDPKLVRVLFWSTGKWWPNTVIHKSSRDALRPTAGCVTLKGEDLIELYDLVPIGTPITIRE